MNTEQPQLKEPWSNDLSSLLQSLHSDPQQGLSEEQVQTAQQTFGKNILSEEKKSSRLVIFIKQFQNTMTYMLGFAVLVSVFLHEYLDATAILVILLLNAIVGYIQEAKAEDSVAALKQLSTPKAKVIRNGKVQVTDSIDVVPGDILQLEAGDYIVADAYLVDAYQMEADEAVLTGESMPVEKTSGVIEEGSPLADRSNMLHAGTALTSGSGHALITATGMRTEIGKIAGLLDATVSEATPLQLRLKKVSNILLMIGGAVMLIIIAIGIVKGFNWVDIFMYAISLAVAAIPEGLPTIVTLALALAVRRMSKRHAIVRKLAAVETLGSTDVICTDKTGTLTTGNMKVRDIFTLDPSLENELKEAAVNCNNASLDHGNSGDPTEVALLLMAPDIRKLPRLTEWSFESVRKRMSVAVKLNQSIRIYTKGAPETTLPRCLLSPEEKSKIDKAILDFSKLGRRILAIASKEIMELDPKNPPEAEEVEVNLKFLGLVAIADPPKPESIVSISQCKAAGIKVIMITGDHPLTAEAIAKELGIIDHDSPDAVMSGAQLEKITPEELRIKSESVLVYARVTPEQKLKIVEALQLNGHTVSMTGDGVNDAPALKKASIGVSMGKAGTEVARQASSMILTDDNFATIVSAVEEGRAINGNIKRTIQYLLSTNIAEIMIVLGSLLIGLPMPFVPLSLLWINLVTDGFPSLALAAEPVEKDFLLHNKNPSPASFFSKFFMMEMFFVGILMTVICLSVYAYQMNVSSEQTARSYAFNLLVYLCLFRSFSCRSGTRTYMQLKLNPYHLFSVAIPLVLQLGLESVPLFQQLFSISEISFKEHIFLIALSIIPVSLVELRKLILQRRQKPS